MVDHIDRKDAGEDVWHIPGRMLLLMAVIGVILIAAFYSGLKEMVSVWSRKEEYGYGYLIPMLTAFFIWQKKDIIEKIPFTGSWAGVFIVLAGILVFILGELSTLYIVIQYAFLITLFGVILALTGWPTFRLVFVPLIMLVFMIPLPNFLYQGLSTQLQLVSSELGVFFIRLFSISVYLEGNVIDLGAYKLQVVEACSGLRYLFPLTALSFVAAYIFKAEFWKRAVVFLSSIPITIIMNSIRIAVIGVLVDTWGVSQAEGFLHYFEGWVIFMACMAILILEIWLLARIGPRKQNLGEAFELYMPPPSPKDVTKSARKVARPLIVSCVVLLAALTLKITLEEREEVIPQRSSFSGFPMVLNEWRGKGDRLETLVLDALKLDDYFIADYHNDAGEQVNLYVAYYASQRKGESVHSPRSCLPGGGWQITGLTQRPIVGVTASGRPLTVNRVEIAKGEYRQLVYYWFQGRGRIITNEYLVKWFLFWDSLIKRRTDGALVRLTSLVAPGMDMDDADRRLEAFAREVAPYLDAYIPKE